MFKSWLWPNRVIGKRESQTLREEHNQLVNSYIEAIEALQECVSLLDLAWEYEGDVFGIAHNDATDTDLKIRRIIESATK